MVGFSIAKNDRHFLRESSNKKSWEPSQASIDHQRYIRLRIWFSKRIFFSFQKDLENQMKSAHHSLSFIFCCWQAFLNPQKEATRMVAASQKIQASIVVKNKQRAIKSTSNSGISICFFIFIRLLYHKIQRKQVKSRFHQYF